ncbi:MAG: bifunctional nuclease family protein [Acidobacteriota bacterium]|nr:bifunctional nuclease family protein [Acidobacteriota bacterium]
MPKRKTSEDSDGSDSNVADALEVEVRGLMFDPSSNTPIVVLREPKSERFLPIWIGVFEAQAIAMRIEGVDSPRPMTHDLLQASVKELGGVVTRIVITDLHENTFFAEVHLARNGESAVVDSRPSDAIALALRAEAPVFVMPAVLDKAKAEKLGASQPDEDQLKEWLENARPEDLGEYEM